jgi:hypothetical protein
MSVLTARPLPLVNHAYTPVARKEPQWSPPDPLWEGIEEQRHLWLAQLARDRQELIREGQLRARAQGRRVRERPPPAGNFNPNPTRQQWLWHNFSRLYGDYEACEYCSVQSAAGVCLCAQTGSRVVAAAPRSAGRSRRQSQA